jgi:Tfp pilus assembly protein PilP
MNWQQPQTWPQAVQRLFMAVAFVVGMGAMAIPVLETWQAWQTLQVANDKRESLQTAIHTLREKIAPLKSAALYPAWTELSASEVQRLAIRHALATSAVHVTRSGQTQTSNPRVMPLWSMQLQLAGSWQAWINWLAQWPTAMPGVTLDHLDLRASPQAGVTAQVGLLLPHAQGDARANEALGALMQEAVVMAHPFDAKAWQQVQQAHAQQHPTFDLYVAPELRRNREPLENYPRDQLRYIGHLSLGSELHALIEVSRNDSQDRGVTPSVHRVSVGNRLGQDFGRILRVQQHQIEIRELVADPSGAWQYRHVTLPFRESLL